MKLNQLKYKFVYFWDSFYGDINDDITNETEMKKYLLPFLSDEQKATNMEDADLIIYSVFKHNDIDTHFAKIKGKNPNALIVHWSGEPHICGGLHTDIVFGGDETMQKAYKPQICYGFLGLMYLRHVLDRYKDKKLFKEIKFCEVQEKQNYNTQFCSIICGCLTDQRRTVYERICKYKQVNGYGGAFPNPACGRYWDYAYIKLLSRYKFNICLENTYRLGYNTEKIINALLAGVIPIYWGSETVFKYVNKDRILYIEKDMQNLEEIMKRLEILDTNEVEYQKVLQLEPFVKPIAEIENLVGSYTYMSNIIKYSLRLRQIRYVCVNLEKRPDRLKKVTLEFQKQNLNVEIFKAVDGYQLVLNDEIYKIFKNNNFCYAAGCIGCAMSHYNVIKQLVNDSNYNEYIILEDDVEFDIKYNEKLKSILMQLPENYGMLYLGFSATQCSNTDTISIMPLNGKVCGTYAYLITKEFAKRLVDEIELNGIASAIDDHYHIIFEKLKVKVYITSSPIVSSRLASVTGDGNVQNRIPLNGVVEYYNKMGLPFPS